MYDDTPGFINQCKDLITMCDYLSFRKMLMPTIIQIVYWVLSALCVIAGIYIIVSKHDYPKGLAITLLSPLVIRLACEIIMVFFRIYETLQNIEKNLETPRASAPVEMINPATEEPESPQTPLFDLITADKKNNHGTVPPTA